MSVLRTLFSIALCATASAAALAQDQEQPVSEKAPPTTSFEEARSQCLIRLGKRTFEPSALKPQPAQQALSPLDKDKLAELEADYIRYEKAWHEHHRRMLTILKREYEQRQKGLASRYQRKVSATEDAERRRHLEAMALLEGFIERYPSSPKYTPDAMFRLADIYLDEAEYQFDKQQDAIAAGTFDPDANSDGDTPYDIVDYSKSIAMWSKITEKFPRYRQRPDVLYLMSYFLKQTGEERRALQVARGLVCANKYNPSDPPPPTPSGAAVRRMLASGDKAQNQSLYDECQPIANNPRIVQEAWVRLVGDSHFYTSGELGEAISAYRQVATNRESKYYDEALYKVAWSYYRNDGFLAAIEAFDQSIKFSDELVAAGKDPLELRAEALQYIALAFTDPWEADGQVNPDLAWTRIMGFYQGRLEESHIRDVFVQLGDTFKVLQAYPQAIDAWNIALAHTELHPENPLIHQYIVTTYELTGDKDAADQEAARLASRYADCTEWYLANEMNRDAMADQRKIGERMLRAAAENTHRAAQKARNDYLEAPSEDKKAGYVALYQRSAALYRQFLETYPASDEIYEFMYRLGETSYFSGDYLAAVRYYQWVRDRRDLSEARFEQSAKSIIQSYEKEIDKRAAAGQLTHPAVPTVEDLKKLGKTIRPLSISEVHARLRSAYDEYQTLVNEPRTAANMGLLAALVSYRHLDLDDAEQRFKQVFNKFCGSREALVAKDAMLAIYEVRGESEKFRTTNQAFIDSKCGSDEDIALAKAQNQAREFRDAEDFFRKKEYDSAAIAFFKYYKLAKSGDPSLPIALYNSAIAYQRSGQPKTAVYLFNEFTSNKRKEFRDSEYYVEALFLTAKAEQEAFDNQNAVDAYLKTARVAAEKGRKQPPGGRTLAQIRLDSLYNAALLREIDRVYFDPRSERGTGAESLYHAYAKLETDRRKQDRAFWQIAQMWRTAANTKRLEAAFEEWRRRFGRDPGNENDYVLSFYLTAKAFEKKGAKRASARLRERTVTAWDEVGRPQRTPAADMAAEFAFEEAERSYRTKFEPWKIRKAPRTEKQAKQVLEALNKISDNTKKNYDELVVFNSPFWSQAALVRIGDVRFFQALKLQQAPVPAEILRLDEKFPEKEILLRYEDAMEKRVNPLTDSAKQQWIRVATAAARAGVSNKWTRLAQERLHDFVSQDEFPVLREELIEGTVEP